VVLRPHECGVGPGPGAPRSLRRRGPGWVGAALSPRWIRSINASTAGRDPILVLPPGSWMSTNNGVPSANAPPRRPVPRHPLDLLRDRGRLALDGLPPTTDNHRKRPKTRPKGGSWRSWRTRNAFLAPAGAPPCAAFHSLPWLRKSPLAHLAHASGGYAYVNTHHAHTRRKTPTQEDELLSRVCPTPKRAPSAPGSDFSAFRGCVPRRTGAVLSAPRVRQNGPAVRPAAWRRFSLPPTLDRTSTNTATNAKPSPDSHGPIRG
jgi:hypothetical protein